MIKKCHKTIITSNFSVLPLQDIPNSKTKMDQRFGAHFLSCCSVSKSCPTLQTHELQHARSPYPSLSPGVCSNSYPLSQWCHPIISSSVSPFPSCPHSFPASRSFPMSQLFASGGQNIRASASASFLPMNIQGWFPLGLTGSISLLSSQESSPAPQFESINSSMLSLLHGPTLTSVHDYWKNHSSDYTDLFGKVMSLLFNTLSRFVIAFLPRSKWLLIS